MTESPSTAKVGQKISEIRLRILFGMESWDWNRRQGLRTPHNKLSMSQPLYYQVEVQGRIDDQWLEWFEGLEILVEQVEEAAATTTLSGTLADQAALHGLLRKLYGRGFVLLRVTCLGSEPDNLPERSSNSSR